MSSLPRENDDGLLVFTYHHSRAEGWTSLVEAVVGAGFSILSAHPVKAEMSVAIPKSQAKEPIQLDMILVCKKKECDARIPLESSEALDKAVRQADQKLRRLMSVGLQLSQNDRRIVVVSQYISVLGPAASASILVQALLKQQEKLEQLAESSLDRADTTVNSTAIAESLQQQMVLPF
jgi:putative DNA methylase